MTPDPTPISKDRAPIRFDAHKGFPMGPILAVGLSLGLAAWMMAPAPGVSAPPVSKPSAPVEKQSVRTIRSQAQEVVRKITAEGETRPMREGQVSPRISGVVSKILVEKGERVEEGQEIVILDVPGFASQEREARARLDEARRERDKIKSLAGKGLATEDQQAKARTSLASAEAAWESIIETRSDMTLRAPFRGVVNDLAVEIGDNVSPGASVSSVLDMSRLVVGATIPQRDAGNVGVGQAARVSLATGEHAEGEVVFVSAVADSGTRSFPVEIQIPNENGQLRAGVSASIVLEGPAHLAHSVPSAYLSLDASGQLSVKLVENGVVVAHKVEIVNSGLDDVQVTGLPEKAEIITVGQGFVLPGDEVRAEVIE